MFLFNLSVFEFLAVFGAISSVLVTLYLLSRSRRKLSVATLRFWNEATKAVTTHQRRRMEQPWSLLLQLLGFVLLLLAVAQLRLGSPETSSRDHVILLDTSSWSGATAAKAVDPSSGNRETVLMQAKREAKRYLRSLPSTDRVMLVRAEGFAIPVTQMEDDREVLRKAIDQSREGAAALNLESAFRFAEQVQKLNARHPGEIVFVGGDRVVSGSIPAPLPSNLRLIPVESAAQNFGIVRVGLRRNPKDEESWQVFVAAKNFGTVPSNIPVAAQFGGAPFGSRVLPAQPGQTVETTWPLRTRSAGGIEARILRNDALPGDNRAILEIPAYEKIGVAVYTSQPELLRASLSAHLMIQPVFRRPDQYRPEAGERVIIFDRFVPSVLPRRKSLIFIDPSSPNSPFAVRTHVSSATIVRWQASHELGSGLRTKDLRLAQTAIFSPAKDDVSIADVEGGPVILARPSAHAVAVGFHPGHGDARFNVATPLLMANILRWLEPDIFRCWEGEGGSVGTVSVPVPATTPSDQIKVVRGTTPLPFTREGSSLRFYSSEPGDIRVSMGDREQVHSLSLPEVASSQWKPAADLRRGVPAGFAQNLARDLWQWLAILGTLVLSVEWFIFGRHRVWRTTSANSTPFLAVRKQPQTGDSRKAS